MGWSLKYTAVRPHSDATVDFVGMGDGKDVGDNGSGCNLQPSPRSHNSKFI